MILGRQTNQWLGLVAALLGFVQVVAIQAGADPVPTATILGSVGTLAGIVIAFIAGSPPVIPVGQTYTVVTEGDAPNVEKVANSYPTPPSSLVPKTPTTS